MYAHCFKEPTTFMFQAMVSESAGGARVSPQESMRSNYKPVVPGGQGQPKSSTLPAHTLSSASTGSAKRA